MVLDVPLDGDRIGRLSLKPHTLTVSFPPSPCFTFDRDGRLMGAFLGDRNYKRGLDNRVMEKHRSSAGGRGFFPNRVRRWLEEGESAGLFQRAGGAAGEVGKALQGGGPSDPGVDRARDWLGRALAWGREGYLQERDRFSRVYRSVGILPPDQYLSVVVQVTEGCPWNRCIFCDFYRHRAYRLRPLGELEGHLEGVADFLGASIGLRRWVFLADANALAIPMDGLIARMDLISRAFPANSQGAGREGICSFLDTFTAPKGPADFRELAARGLRRVYVGLETGDEGLLRFLKKPGTPAQAVSVVRAARSAGVRVGVIALAGAGGDRFSEAHVKGTVRVIREMGLGKGDLLYLSEVVAGGDSEYTAMARTAGIRPLLRAELEEQAARIREGVEFGAPAEGPRLSSYDVREFLY